jgi:hypothetical protein
MLKIALKRGATVARPSSCERPRQAPEDKTKELKSASFYQASIYAWNAFREDKTITNVKYDTKKGLYTIAA